MQNLNKTFLFIGFLATHLLNAQSSVTFDGSKVFSSFKFVNSHGETDKYSYSSGSAYHLGYLRATKSRILLGGGIGIRKAGATKVVTETNFEWDLQYAEAKVQIGYLFDKWRLSPVALVSPYFASLLKANETIDGKTHFTSNALLDTDFGLTASLGVNMKLSDYIYIYSFYNQIVGIKNIEKKPSQKLYNRGFSITMGLGFTINKLSPNWIK